MPGRSRKAVWMYVRMYVGIVRTLFHIHICKQHLLASKYCTYLGRYVGRQMGLLGT